MFVCFRTLKRLSLPGTLPPQLAKLPFLREVYDQFKQVNHCFLLKIIVMGSYTLIWFIPVINIFFILIFSKNSSVHRDFAYNCFTGSIPEEWASMKLTSM